MRSLVAAQGCRVADANQHIGSFAADLRGERQRRRASGIATTGVLFDKGREHQGGDFIRLNMVA